jgi:hypothetical protein
MEKVDAEPGLNMSMLKTLAQKKLENPEDYTQLVNFIIFLMNEYLILYGFIQNLAKTFFGHALVLFL